VRRAIAAILLAAATVTAASEDPSALLNRLRADERSSRAPSPEEYSHRLNAIGVVYLEAGDLPRSIELLTEAATRDPDNGVALANLSYAYLKNDDLEFAEFYLDLARHSRRASEPPPEFYVALGNIYETLHRIDDAIAAWEEARGLGADGAGLDRRIRHAQTEWAYSHGQSYLAGQHFQVFYDSGIPSAAAETVERILERAADAEAEFFLAPAPQGQVVILYEGRRYFAMLDTPDWVGGFYDGKLRIPIERESAPDERIEGLLGHELAHAYLHRVSQGRAPAWLQEGLAQYVEGRRTDRRELQRIGARPGGFLDSSTDAFHQRTDRDHARRAYALALSFVEFLARRGGPESAVCLAYSLGAGKTIDAACEENFGAPLSGLERQWIASLS
jgi:tetratricopeptide (TPR) repeat protein